MQRNHRISHSALLHAGKYFKFDYPKSVDTWGGGINDKRTVIGAYAASQNLTLDFAFAPTFIKASIIS